MDAKLINATTDLVALVPGLHRAGQYHIGPCPFCGGKDRFTIKHTGEGDLWICRNCGDDKYHDAVAFLMRAEGRSFKEVMRDTRYETRDTKYEIRDTSSEALSSLVAPPDEEWQIARLIDQKRLADRFRLSAENPTDDPLTIAVAWHYLRVHRGLLPDTIRRAMLGFNPDGGLLPDGSTFPPGIHIPCMAGEQLWYVKARLPKVALEASRKGGRPLPKYMMLRGSRTALFNADALPGARVAVVVEGEFDALLLGQFLPDGWAAVTMGGAGSLPDERFLPYFSGIERVLLGFDADPAGRRALASWQRLLGWAEAAPPLPAGVKDVTEFWQQDGDLRGWLRGFQ
jgi:hypothetical protein